MPTAPPTPTRFRHAAAGSILLLAGFAPAASAQTFPPDAAWLAVTRGGTPIFDAPLDTGIGGTSHRDVVGVDEPSVWVYADESFYFFRLRVDGDPTSTFLGGGWVVELDLDHNPVDYDALAMVNGIGDQVLFYSGESGEEPLDPAVSTPTALPIATHARSVSDGSSDFFVDWAVPISLLAAAGSDLTTMRLVAGCNSNGSPFLPTGNSGDVAGESKTWMGTITQVLSDPIPASCQGFGCAVAVPHSGPGVDGRLRVSPNPAVGAVRFDLADTSPVELAIFAVDGRRIRRLACDGQAAIWDGRDDAGRLTPAGVYTARLRTKSGSVQRTFVRLR